MAPALQNKIQDILFNMDKNPKGREILNQIGVDKFIMPPKGFYDSIYYYK